MARQGAACVGGCTAPAGSCGRGEPGAERRGADRTRLLSADCEERERTNRRKRAGSAFTLRATAVPVILNTAKNLSLPPENHWPQNYLLPRLTMVRLL